MKMAKGMIFLVLMYLCHDAGADIIMNIKQILGHYIGEDVILNVEQHVGEHGDGHGQVVPPTDPPLPDLEPGANCYRTCVPGDTRACHFVFMVGLYQTLSRACFDCPNNQTDCSRPLCIAGDGIMRRVVVINKQIPGPHIQVCQGDQIVVDVKNRIQGAGITIHWHGITQKGPNDDPSLGTPFMDGVPGITQCPIQVGSDFRYSFLASNAGSHWYHAHTGFHRGDGFFGPITIRQTAAMEPNIDQYDYDLPEHSIIMNDWTHVPTPDKFALNHHNSENNFPDSILVNGQGPFQNPAASASSASIPYRRFKVTAGSKYRMRLVSTANLMCPITFSIEQHMLTIIASDGNPVVPFEAKSLVLYAGERFDVVVNADPAKSGGFWMCFMGGIDCADTAAHQFAILEYDENVSIGSMTPKPMFTEVPPAGIQVNSINRACSDNRVCVADLRSPDPLPSDVNQPDADFTFYLAFEMRRIHNPHTYSAMYYPFHSLGEDQQLPTPQINNLSFGGLPIPLLLNPMIDDDKICNAATPLPGKDCDEAFCQCLHMYKIPLGSSVDLVFIDEGHNNDENHPAHLHGASFWVLGQDRPNDIDGASITRDEVIQMDAAGQLKRNFDHPIFKDTITIPDGGYTVVRFKADNPGFWLLHCHLIFHSESGMALVLKVGNDYEIPDVPADFPTCGNYGV